ncbi:flagellar hook-length control protein FliK [Amphritea sp. 1_MG-2023]|uniref:flagellar hook-length control protein FliK n=1 Tax=Amphritea sp. 1_MG-2023 TaxID=3062670 RepID=UPI0026E2CBD2|nr:flagellar hook-length control protein FliK [Amphritea sp. 1_MG-2023]MDO6564679.1 flagellar hook-length control protein FliK [Amphritea sp. 1_MG-2023]
MGQTLSTSIGVGPLSTVTSASGSRVNVSGVPSLGALSVSTAGTLTAFDISMQQAQARFSAIGEQADNGQSLPPSGRLLPAASSETNAAAMAEASAVQIGVDSAAKVTQAAAEQATERLVVKQSLPSVMTSDSVLASRSKQHSDDASDTSLSVDATLKQVDQYRRADLAVAVDSALQRLANRAEHVGNGVSTNASTNASTSATTVTAARVAPVASADASLMLADAEMQAESAGVEMSVAPQAASVRAGLTDNQATLHESLARLRLSAAATSATQPAASSALAANTATYAEEIQATTQTTTGRPEEGGIEGNIEGSIERSIEVDRLNQASRGRSESNSIELRAADFDASTVSDVATESVATQPPDTVSTELSQERSQERSQELLAAELQTNELQANGLPSSLLKGAAMSESNAALLSQREIAGNVGGSHVLQTPRVGNDGVPASLTPQAATPVTGQHLESANTSAASAFSVADVRAKLQATDSEKSTTLELSRGGENRVESQKDTALSSFAESLASVSKATRNAQEVPQTVMPNGLRPGSVSWGQAVNDRVMLMASKNGQFAEIQLDPPELGSLQVKLQVKNDQVSVVFNTPHGSTREALEQNMPRLREMFADQGLNLSDSSVEDQGGKQQREESKSETALAGYQSDRVDDARAEASVTESLSLVDYYA